MGRKGFLECGSTMVLQELAANAVDLSKPGVLSPQRIARFSLVTEGLTFSYATERLDETVLTSLQDLALERGLCATMEAMQLGAVVNKIEGFPSEARPALHVSTRIWLRNVPLQGEAAAVALQSKLELHKLSEFLHQYRDRFTTLVQIGIGGSELGPKALYTALLGCCSSDKKVYFVSNVDPDDAAAVLGEIDCACTLVVVVSKSGTTLETTVNEALFAEYFAKHGLAFEKHCVAVTCAGTPMDDSGRYLEVFYLWESIGGRFSSTSMVGGVVIGFAFGTAVFESLLAGAAALDVCACLPQLKENLPMLSAMIGIWNRNFLGYPTTAVIPYSSGLRYFPAHLQQCMMESNGKSITTTGEQVGFATSPVIWGEVGTNSQHSFFQCLHQGTDCVPVEFIGFLHNQRGLDINLGGSSSSQKLFANMVAQAIALAQGRNHSNPNKAFRGNRPSSLLVADTLSPYTLGALLAFYEHKITFQGFCWGINSFDQEGVSLGKDLADQVTRLMRGQGSFPEAAALLKLFIKET